MPTARLYHSVEKTISKQIAYKDLSHLFSWVSEQNTRNNLSNERIILVSTVLDIQYLN